MSNDDAIRGLRGTVFKGDGSAVIRFLTSSGIPEDSLQLAGDGLLGALDQEVDGAPELARQLIDLLSKRDWSGDEILADQLNVLLGAEPAAMSAREARSLRPLAVDLDELSTVLEGDPVFGGGRVDRETGEVWHQAAVDYAREAGDELTEEDEDYDEDAEDRWLWIHCQGPHDAYRDMKVFASDVADEDLARSLSNALYGQGAFRRFKEALLREPDVRESWYAFSSERQRARARFWLADAGYRVTLSPRPA
ncbi:MAG: UPF0158 family protein [Streptosporangiales bacterium]|jgi:hypothetical protein|nr:UPF0158 family protein [Streptosporangiales bacterium]